MCPLSNVQFHVWSYWGVNVSLTFHQEHVQFHLVNVATI